MAITAGRMLLHYRCVEPIGAGGMGVVWRAEDTTLGRDVAIKILPEIFAGDVDRLARFEREARLLASLEHDNIARVFGLHEAEGVRFLAMEYVRGEDLAKRLGRARLSVEETLGLARQIAEALEAAHRNGVVHRDLKPANVVITPEGKVKVLDFGLAKAFETEAPAANPSLSPTLTSAGTLAGVILGTAAYMSPEQARGHAADKRSDVWAFGCVLFEMLTGRMVFPGDTVSDTLAAVLKVEPDFTLLPAGTPRPARRLLERCLQKDPRRRLHDVADARIEIEDALSAPVESATAEQTAAGPSGRPRAWLAVALATLALAVGVAIGWKLKPGSPGAPPLRRFVLPVVVADGEEVSSPRISPDGRKVVYGLAGGLRLQELDQFRARALDGTTGAREPFWSPDSSTIGYFADGKLWKLAAAGGQAALVCDLPKGLSGASWGEGGTIVVISGENILKVSSRGGDPEMVQLRDRTAVIDYHGVAWLPGERGLLVVEHRTGGSNFLQVWSGEARTTLLELEDAMLGGASYAAPGFVVFSRWMSNEGVWALPVSPERFERTGEPVLVAPQGEEVTVSSDGTLVYLYRDASANQQLVRVAADGASVEPLGQPQRGMWLPSLSPDGSKLVVTGQEAGEWDVWVHDTVRQTKTRLTFLEEIEGTPTWSSDGKTVYFHHPVFGDAPTIYEVPVDGSGEPRALTSGGALTVSADGGLMALVRAGGKGDDLWWMGLGGGEPRPFLENDADEWAPALSPDGRYLAYVSDESGRGEVYVKPFPAGEGKWQVSGNGGEWPRWSRAGDRLFFVNEASLFEVRVDRSAGLSLGNPRPVFDGRSHRLMLERGFDIGPDGSEIFAIRRGQGDAQSGPPPGPEIRVEQGWLAGLTE